MTINQAINEKFPEAQLDTHESDLYVKDQVGMAQFIRENHKHHANVTSFISQIDNEKWFDIPFANDAFWNHADKQVEKWAEAKVNIATY